MRKTPASSTRLAGALLLALAMPLAAQVDPAGEAPMAASAEADAWDEDPMMDEGLDEGLDEGSPQIAAGDPSILDAEMMPRAARSLLLDVVRTPAGYFAVGERGHVLRSADGQDWTQLHIPTRSTLTTIAAHDGVLWAAGHDGVIVHSTDGGQTWQRRRTRARACRSWTCCSSTA